jgi:hypothetical protein
VHGAADKISSKKGASQKKGATKNQKAAKRGKAKAVAPKKQAKAAKPRTETKGAKVLELIGRIKGATIAEIMKATGWQAHSVRGFISGALINKRGLRVDSFRNDNKERTYRFIQ